MMLEEISDTIVPREEVDLLPKHNFRRMCNDNTDFRKNAVY